MCKPSDEKNSELDKLQREEDAKIKNMLREGAKEIRRWALPDEGRLVPQGGALVEEIKVGDAAAAVGEKKPAAVEAKKDEEDEDEEEEKEHLKSDRLKKEAEAEAVMAVGASADKPKEEAPVAGSGAILGMAPPPSALASGPLRTARAGSSSADKGIGCSSSGVELSVRHTLHANGDDLEVVAINSEGDIVPVEADAATGGALPSDSVLEGSHWTHVSAKRAIAYGCHFFSVKVASLPPPIYSAKSSNAWEAAQLVLGIVTEDRTVPIAGVASGVESSDSCPLAFYAQGGSPGFTNNGCRVDASTGALSAPERAMSFRAGDIVSLLVDLDQPGGVQMSLYKNGYALESKQANYSNLQLAKHTHVKIAVSLRGAGHLISLAELNFVDRALWRFEVDNALPADERLPRGASRVPMMAQQNALKHKVRWLPLVAHNSLSEDPVPASLSLSAEAREPELDEVDEGDEEEGEEMDLGEGHHDPLTMRLASPSEVMVINGMEALYGPGGAGQVINLQASAPLAIWGQSEKQYYELEVRSKDTG